MPPFCRMRLFRMSLMLMVRYWALTASRWMGQAPCKAMMSRVRFTTWWCMVPVLVWSTTPGDAIPAPESLDVVGPGVVRLLLPDFPGSLPPPIDWKQVEDNVEFACSLVVVMERLLRETSALEATTTWDSAMTLVKDVRTGQPWQRGGAREKVSRVEAKSATALASDHEDAEGLVRQIALLEGELVEARRSQDVAEENSRGLSNAVADAERRWEESERELRELFEELTLLQTRGSELCLAIVGPPRVKNHLLEVMQIAVLRHTEMVGELATLRTVVSSVTEFMLGCCPTKPSRWKLWMS
jgi:hypothetical protein